jgi:TonB family protein
MQGFLAFAVGLTLLAASPESTDQADLGYVADPIWVIEPPAARVAADLPRSGYENYVPLFCTVHGDVLTACRPFGPAITAEYLEAAAEAAQTARIAPQDGEGSAVEGRDVFLFINFPGNANASASSVVPPVTPGVMWQQRPSVSSSFYPQAARASGVTGAVVLDCLVTRSNPLICTVVQETPRGLGFGTAALQASRDFQIAARRPDGTLTAGGRLRVPLRFNP